MAEQWLAPAGCVGHLEDCADFVGDDGVTLADLAKMASQWGISEAIPVVITEIHYNPDLPYELVEFVEIYNAGTETIDLSGWYFSKGISFTFGPDASIEAGQYLVVTEDSSFRTVSPVTSVHDKYGTDASLIYGPFVRSLNNEGEIIELRNSLGVEVDQVDYQLGFPWPIVGDEIPKGSYGNGHSIQLVNPNLDNDMGGSWRSAYPTPGAANSAVYAENIPPHIRQVEHTPKQPAAGENVTITAKVTDTDGVAAVTLKYQVNTPGNYIPITLPNLSTSMPTLSNPDYEFGWQSLSMHDDGLNGDQYAGDFVYTAQLPAGVQGNRNLVRYRIQVEDNGNRSITVPYADDPQPNFAYFVYDGVPAWTGNGVTYTPEVMNSLPVYHLIARNSDVEDCFWNSSWNDSLYHFAGTFVYDGEVYDHIYYHIRGQYSTYRWGKNKSRFNFNRGHKFQARDNYGKKYDTKWDNIVTGTGTCPWWQWPHPGNWDQGAGGMVMNEPLGYLLYNMAGVPSPHTNFFHFRVVDNVSESGADQYSGDFWGLFFAIENPDGRYLDEHDMADGNVYKMENGFTDQRNQGPTQVIDNSDVSAFVAGQTTSSSQTWWQNNLNLDGYYSYKTVGIVINNSDPRPQENCFYYHDPLTDKWSIHPWDLDLTFEWATHYTDWEHIKYCLNYSDYNIAYRNRARELADLLFDNDHYGWRQIDQLVEEMSSIISRDINGQRFIDAERALWDDHPRVSSSYDNLWYEHNEYFTQPGNTKSWESMVDYYQQFMTPTGMSDFLSGSYGLNTLLSEIDDSAIPDTPVITYIGEPNYPENDLRFQAAAYSDPQGVGTFAAMKWRIAEVDEPNGLASDPETPVGGAVQLIASASDWYYFKGNNAEPSDPVDQWRTVGFDDSNWLQGQSSIGYGDNDDNTILDDMRDNYNTIYLRKTFEMTDVNVIESINFNVYVDDGCIIWINGTEVARPHCSDGFKAWNSLTEADYVDNAQWESVILPTPYDYFVEGTNIIAIHVLNSSTSSSDLSIDINLTVNYSGQGGNSDQSSFVYNGKRGYYEIDPVWESPEMTAFESDIQIPADGVTAGKTYRVRCRMKDNTGRWSHWSAPIQFMAGEAKDADILSYLRLTELMYNNGDADFIELKNISSSVTLDLTNVSITSGVQFSFAGSHVTSLTAGAYVLVIKDQAAFEAQYGTGLSSQIAGVFIDSSLSNGGETIKIEDYWNGTIIEFEYNDARGWPLAADGAGHSLVPLPLTIEEQPLGTLDFGGNWRQSAYIGGSPGAEDPVLSAGIVINEFMAHTDYSNPANPDYDSNDWIELYNAGGSSVAFDGNWYLSDDSDDLDKWAMPAGILNTAQWISYDEVTGFHCPITSGFGLDKAGEQLFLSYLPGNGMDRVVDCIQFKGQENSVSLSRYPDGENYWFSSSPRTRDTANGNLREHVVISEIMYHPIDDNEEYIELYNPTDTAVDLWTVTGPWSLDGGINFEFPSSISLASGARIVIVDFDPANDTARLDAFETDYGTGNLTAGVDIFGPWSGDLSNNGERITLEKPQDSDDLLNPAAISWIIVDECIYNDYWPWPPEPDGTGLSLHRLSSDKTASGNNAANWYGQTPTAGW